MSGVVYLSTLVYASDLAFSGTINLSNDPLGSQSPLLAAAGSNVYAVWLDNTDGNPDVVFRASNNNGSSFGPVVNLSNTPNGFSRNPQTAAVGTYVYVVWEDNSTGNEEVLFRASPDGGNTWNPPIGSAPLNLSHDTRNCDPFLGCLPQIAASSTSVYITWVNGVTGPSGSTDIFFVVSTNNGGTFTGIPVNLSDDKVSITPMIAAVGSNVYVAWQDANGGKNDLFLRASTNGGSTWNPPIGSAPTNLSNNPLSPATSAISQQIAAVSNNVYVVWTNSSSAEQTVFRASLNNGASFGNVVRLSGIGSTNPEMAGSGSYVHIVWETHVAGTSTVSYRVSGNNGASFAEAISLSSSSGFALYPQIASTGSNVYVAWQDSSGSNDVFFRSSSDNGASFGDLVNLSNNSGFSTEPSVATNGDNAYVAWQDDTLGNDDILFRIGAIQANQPPLAYSKTDFTIMNASVTIFLAGSDPDGDPLTFAIVTNPAHGTLGPISPAGPATAQIVYTPASGFVGLDSFTFKVDDGKVDSSPATVFVIVSPYGGGGGGGGGRVVLL